MPIRMPEKEDYGVTSSQYQAHIDSGSLLYPLLGGCMFTVGSALTVLGIVKPDISIVFLFGMIGLFLGTCSILESFKYFKRLFLLRGDVKFRIKLYEEEVEIHRMIEEEDRQESEKRQKSEREERKRHTDYWMSLSGRGFELELGNLYIQLGYEVESTPTSGDEGIDLILRKDGKTTVVQCKSHKHPVGPATARRIVWQPCAFRR